MNKIYPVKSEIGRFIHREACTQSGKACPQLYLSIETTRMALNKSQLYDCLDDSTWMIEAHQT